MSDESDFVWVAMIIVMAGWIGYRIGNCCREVTKRPKKERRHIKSLAATYDLPAEHVDRALDVFGLFPATQTRKLMQSAERNRMTAVQWHQAFADFVERTARNDATASK